MTEMVAIAKIREGERRREDHGDISELAKSMAEEGQFHEIGITDDNRLIYGGRRLKAAKSLGWRHIRAWRYENLDDLELRRKELAENLQRLDLSQLERDKTMVKLVETVAAIAEEETVETRPESGRVSTRGPSAQPGSQRDVSRRTGIPVQTINDAKQHVDALEKYPELEAVYTAKAQRTMAANRLDEMEEEEREEAREGLRQGRTLKQLNRSTKQKQEREERAQKEDEAYRRAAEEWAAGFYRVTELEKAVKRMGGIEELALDLDPAAIPRIVDELDKMARLFTEWRKQLLKTSFKEGAN